MLPSRPFGQHRANRGPGDEVPYDPKDCTAPAHVAVIDRLAKHGRVAAHEGNEHVPQPGQAIHVGRASQKGHPSSKRQRTEEGSDVGSDRASLHLGYLS